SDNGNISATLITATEIFNDDANGDYTLKSTSPVINKGNNVLNTSTVDLGGEARLSGAVIDLGAYEYQEGTLPVTLISFAARADDDRVKLQWQTVNEINNKGFEIWRKVDGGKAEGLGFVKLG